MAIDYFLKIDGIQGESTDAKHKGEIDVQSWSWGLTRPVAPGGGGGGGSTGRAVFQALTVVAPTSAASPNLFLSCASGKHHKSAILTGRKAGKAQQDFLTLTLTDVLVSAYQAGGSEAGETVPLDQVSLTYSKFRMEYKAQKADGSLGSAVKAGWDVAADMKF
jgi:type VI secretion system secreted protein Hcp